MAIVVGVALTGAAARWIGGLGGSALLSERTREVLGFLILVNYLVSLVLVELVNVTLFATTVAIGHGIKSMLKTVRETERTTLQIYGGITAQLIIASVGIGLALEAYPRLADVLVVSLVLWRLIIARICCETKKTLHSGQRPPFSKWERLVNFFADVPWIVVLVICYFWTGNFLWIVGAVLVLSYTFLVRAGHYAVPQGPMGFLSSLFGLLGASCIILFACSRDSAQSATIISAVLAFTMSKYSISKALDVTMPPKKRIIQIVLSLLASGIFIWIVFFDGRVDFSESTVFSKLHLGVTSVLTMGIAFVLPIGLYYFVLECAKARQWLFVDRESGFGQLV